MELERKTYIFAVFSGLFCGALCIGVAIGSKLISIFGVVASLSAFTYPITFFITDTIGEVYGKAASKKIILSGLWSLMLMLGLVQIAIIIPGASTYNAQEAFISVFGSTYRYIIGGTLAYMISQSFDVWIFHYLKDKMKGKNLWLRNNLSTIMSQLIDTSIFVVIAFAGVTPLLPLILGQFLLKAFLAIVDTPFVYMAVKRLKKNDPF